ncbi:ABC transporter permease [Rahnella rivi]|uniref:ABC transporter permease n=1 Tax=Rahnella TaxID=34037 RepID=UPI00070036B9|nr:MULTISPECIES: ABC transporter permease [Rahnella]KQN50143.1 diguanylate cyclase [Serratia sp. Leaf51]MBB6113764.1 glutathione transport system permease protein [Rahnella inusitata]MBU9831083.1 ABC transporter permease [Rahnella rivi]
MSAIITPLARRKPRTLRFFRWLWRHPAVTLGGFIVSLIVLAGLFAPLITRHDPYAQDLIDTLLPPDAGHWFGTDDYGRDIFARVIYGARISIIEVVLSVGLAMIIGIPLGIIAGMAGRYTDMIIMWFMDMLFAFPGIVLAILVVSILGGGLVNLLIAISLFAIPVYARLSRNLTLGLKQMEYVEAAQALGLSNYRIIVHYILRNAIGPIIVQSTLTAGTVILAAASLSFLGLGVQPPMPEWGTMMSDGRNFLGINIYLSLFPGLAIMLTVLGFNVLGDGLRDLLDTRS